MKIYFAGSMSGGHADNDIYHAIIKLLQNYGDVLTEHLDRIEDGMDDQEMTDEELYTQDSGWIKEVDVIVAEITQPSLGVGYAIGMAEALGKPVLGLYRMIPDRKVSPMIKGNPYVTNFSYTNVGDIEPACNDFFANQ